MSGSTEQYLNMYVAIWPVFAELIHRFTSRRCVEYNVIELSKCFMVFLVNGESHLFVEGGFFFLEDYRIVGL